MTDLAGIELLGADDGSQFEKTAIKYLDDENLQITLFVSNLEMVRGDR